MCWFQPIRAAMLWLGTSCLPHRRHAMSGKSGSLSIGCQACSPSQQVNGFDIRSPFIACHEHGTAAVAMRPARARWSGHARIESAR